MNRRAFLKAVIAVPLAAAAAPLLPRVTLRAVGPQVFTYRGIPWVVNPLLDHSRIVLWGGNLGGGKRSWLDYYEELIGDDKRYSLRGEQ